MKSISFRRTSCLSLFTLVLNVGSLLLLSGCGTEKGPRQFNITGNVTYDGQPLMAGRITFVPDHDRGNSGPPGYALIQKGVFDTRASGGKPSVSGPLKVMITGFDMSAEAGGEAKDPLFEGYTIPAEIDPAISKTAIDFEVPKIEKKKKK